MPHGARGLYHLDKRRRYHHRKKVNADLEPYPHPNLWMQAIDYTVTIVGIVIPLMTIPQIVKSYTIKDVSSPALGTWFAYLFSSLFWFAYGLIHRSRPILVNSFLWFLMNMLVIVGALIYR